MINDFGLIHMTQRGSAEMTSGAGSPLGGDAGNSQSYNRYSYVWNNSMTSVDPSGYSA